MPGSVLVLSGVLYCYAAADDMFFVVCYLHDGGDVWHFILFEGRCLRGVCILDLPTAIDHCTSKTDWLSCFALEEKL